jgi:hypothetical protein
LPAASEFLNLVIALFLNEFNIHTSIP